MVANVAHSISTDGPAPWFSIAAACVQGTMTLLLGGPGSSKSTLLKVLSGRLQRNTFEIGGSVLYNKEPFSEFVVERTAAYVDQVGAHNTPTHLPAGWLAATSCAAGARLPGMHTTLPALRCM